MISVIIPVYNGEATIGALLDSLLSNHHGDSEIIVVDDGGTDRTMEIASRYAVRSFSTGGRRGPAVARNIGAREARGDVMLFLDADTQAPECLLNHVAERFNADPTLVAVVGYYDKRPLNAGRFARYKALMVHHWFTGAKVMESFETCCGAIRRDAFFKAGGFDESYTDADVEDYEFGYRVIAQGPILVDHEMIVGHNFPSFSKNFRNYRRRAKLWMSLFLKRRRFESTATTPGEGITRLLGVVALSMMFLGLFVGPFFWAGILIFIVYLQLLRQFLALLWREEGPLFMLWGICAHVGSSFAVALGVSAAVYNYLCDALGVKRVSP